MKETNASVIVNDSGHILTYTVRSYKSQCEEIYPPETWKALQALGAKIIRCKIILDDE